MNNFRFYRFLLAIALFTFLFSFSLFADETALYDKYLNYQKKEISNAHLLQVEWLKPDLDYVKITTTKDGIARLPVEELLSIFPQWTAKNSANLNLFYKGLKYPYYLKDQDGTLSKDDTLYFIGKRADADTTWFNNYTREEAFFITYDENSTSKRLNLVDQNLEDALQLSSVPIDLHIEEEHIYDAGKQLYDSYTSDNEGWYWSSIAPISGWSGGSTFTYNINLDLEPGDELDLYVAFRTSADTLYFATGSNLYPEYNVTFFFNNDSIDNRIFTRMRKDSFHIHLTYENTVKGYNNIKIISNENHPKRNAALSVDYISIKGKSKPIAYMQFFTSKFENITQKSIVKIPNFHSNWIVGIDSINNQILFPSSEIENNAFISLKKNDKGLYFFGFRNNISYDTVDNFHLTIIPNSNPDSVVFYKNWYFASDFDKFVENAEPNSIIIFSINVTSYLPQEVTAFINKYGGKLSSNFTNNTGYYLIFQKNNKLIDEDVIQSNIFAKTISFNNLNLSKNLYSCNLILNNSNSIIYLNDETQIEKPKIYKVNKPYLTNLDNQADVVVIYNEYFKNQAQDYINYRSMTTGLKFLAVNVEDIYNEYNYGKKGVQCIKDYLVFAYNNWKNHKLKYLVLFGNASWDPRQILTTSISTDFVPVYGYPPSDYWYSLLDDDLNADIGVGRISASTITDAENYIKKLKIYDALPDEPWMKNFIFLSGGYNPTEIRSFSLAKYMFFDEPIISPPFCGTTDSVVKIYYQEAVSERQGGEIREKINNGALWVNYLGHANSESFDFDGWQAFRLNNYPKFSFFSTLSCNTGAHAEPNVVNSRNEDYLFYPDKGFIGSVGSATWGWVDENRWVAQKMVENLTNPNSTLVYVSDLINYGKKSLANQEAPLWTKFHYTLIGDPLLKLRTSRSPNLYIYPDQFTITTENNSQLISTTDSLAYIKGIVYNNGYQTNLESQLLLIDTYQNKSDTTYITLPIICNSFPFHFSLDISEEPGQHDITLLIDPEQLIDVEKPQNRVFKTSFFVYSDNLVALDPQNGWNVNKSDPVFRVLNPNSKDDITYHFSIFDAITGETVKFSNDNEISIKENYIDWKPIIDFQTTDYIFEAYYTFQENQTSEKMHIPFYVSDSVIENKVFYKNSITQDFNKFKLFNTKIDTVNNAIILQNNNVHYHLVSASRDQSIRWANIEIGDKVYVDNEFAMGFNVVSIPIYNDGSLGTYKRFNTWGENGDYWQMDSVGYDLVKYLRDSIPENSYLFIATGDRSFRIPSIYQAFAPESLSSLDSLKAVLRNYGSALIDSINGPLDWENTAWNTWPHSFAMIGKKGWKPGEAIEAMSPVGDSSALDGYIPLYQMDGEITTNIIGPGQTWSKLTVHSTKDDTTNNNNIILQILGNKDNQNHILLEQNILKPIEIFDLSTDTFKNYHYLQLQLKLQRTDTTTNPSFRGFNIDFTPVPELAMLQSMTFITDSSKMRGYPSKIHYAFENLSLRTSVDSTLFQIKNYTQNGSYEYSNKTYYEIGQNSIILDSISLQTDLLAIYNQLISTINSNSNPLELYNFNNSTTNYFSVFEDTTKPIIKTTFDGKDVAKGDFIAEQPLITISIYDNTPFLMDDSTKIEVYINGLFITPLNVNQFEFKSIKEEGDLKAVLKIIPNNLEYGEDIINPSNNIRIIAFDPSGNSDTVVYKLNVMQNSILQDLSTYPNPAEDKVNFKFKYLGRNMNETGTIQIYNLNGQIINSIPLTTQIGENTIPYDLYDENGNIFAMGVYFYRISMNSEFYTEPKLGMFVVTR